MPVGAREEGEGEEEAEEDGDEHDVRSQGADEVHEGHETHEEEEESYTTEEKRFVSFSGSFLLGDRLSADWTDRSWRGNPRCLSPRMGFRSLACNRER